MQGCTLRKKMLPIVEASRGESYVVGTTTKPTEVDESLVED